jgi:hypothetical protein
MTILRNCEAGGSLKDTMAMVVIFAFFSPNGFMIIIIIFP